MLVAGLADALAAADFLLAENAEIDARLLQDLRGGGGDARRAVSGGPRRAAGAAECLAGRRGGRGADGHGGALLRLAEGVADLHLQRLQQLLAQAGYLPLHWQPLGPPVARSLRAVAFLQPCQRRLWAVGPHLDWRSRAEHPCVNSSLHSLSQWQRQICQRYQWQARHVLQALDQGGRSHATRTANCLQRITSTATLQLMQHGGHNARTTGPQRVP